MELNQIIFEHIDNEYAYGKYADFTIIMMKSNRYINATKLCSEYGKEFKTWAKTDKNKELINKVINEIYISGANQHHRSNKYDNPSMIVIKGGKKEKQLICGTYVHELLIPHIATWISPKFGIMVSKIVNNYVTTEYIKLIEKQNITIQEKDDKIDKLMKMMEESEKRAEKRIEDLEKKASKRSKKLEEKLDDTNIKLDVISEELTETKQELKYTNKKLNISLDDRVPKPEDEKILEYFILLKSKRKNPIFKYYTIRGQKRYIDIKLKMNEDKYTEIFRINGAPNSVDILNKLKKHLGKKISSSGNKINLESIDENEFIENIKDVYDNRKVISINIDEESNSDN